MKANRREKAGPSARAETADRRNASDARYRRLFESARDGILILDAKTGTVMDVNPSLIETLGYSHDAFLGKKVWDLGFFKDVVANQADFAELQQKECARHEDTLLETADGRRIEVEFESNVYLVDDQKVVQCSIRDTTERRRVAEALRESEGRFRSYVENANDIVYTLSPSGILTYVSPNWEVTLGHDVRDVIGQSFTRFVHPDDVPACRRFLEQALATGGRAGRIEYRVQHKDGSWRWHSSSGSTLVDDTSTLTSYIGIARDITTRKQAEQALSMSEERFRRVSLLASDVVYSCIAKEDGRFALDWMTGAAEHVTGYSLEEIMAQGCWSFLVVKDDLGLFEENVVGLPHGSKASCELRLRHKNGAIVWLSSYAESDSETQTPGRRFLLGSLTDITERKQAEERIRASEAHLEEAQRTAHLGSWEMDLITGQTTWSDELCRLFEIPPETIRAGRSQLRAAIDERIHPDDRARYTQAVARTVDQKMPYDIDYRIQLPDGSQRHIHAEGAPSSDPAGNLVRLAGTAIDITERKKAEDALRESEDRYRTLVDNVPGIIFTIDLAGKITFVTRRVKDTLGYESAEVINKSVVDFIPEEERQRAMEAIQKGMTGVGIKRFETPMIKRSGERAWFECSFTRVRRDGAVIGAQGTAVDITERKQVEQELRRDQEMLARTEAIAHVGSWDWDVATDTVTWSGELFRIFQREPREGAPSFAEHPALYPPDDMARLRRAVEAALAEGTPYELELRAIRRDGKMRLCVARGRAEVVPGGCAVSLFGSLQDITERKQAEEALSKSQTQFKELFGQMSSGVAVYEAIDNGGDFVFRDFNPAAETIERIGRKEVIGRRVSEAFPGVKALGAFDVFRRVWQTGKPEHLSDAMYEDTRLGASWRDIWVYKLPSGEIVAVYNDVTERKQAEARGKTQLEELQRWEAVMLDREDRTGKLKREVNELLRRLGEPIRYPSQEDAEAGPREA